MLFKKLTLPDSGVIISLRSLRCSIEDDIMGQFQYSANKTTAVVNFQAHKFPYTTSVYYQCHVHLCSKANGGCANTVNAIVFRVNRTRWVARDDDNAKLIVTVFSFRSRRIARTANGFAARTKLPKTKAPPPSKCIAVFT